MYMYRVYMYISTDTVDETRFSFDTEFKRQGYITGLLPQVLKFFPRLNRLFVAATTPDAIRLILKLGSNIPKSGLLSGLWEGNTDDPNAMGFKADMTPMTIERVERNAMGEPQLETFLSKTGYESTKYLGLHATDTVTYGETEDKVAEKIRHLSCKAKAAKQIKQRV